MTDTFETFWTDYPRKVAKEAARKAYAKAVSKHGADPILKGLVAWNSVRKPTEAQFIPHASTWLNQGRYLDDHEDLASDAMGYHTAVAPRHEVLVNGRIYRFLELNKIRRAIIAGNSIYDPDWTAFKKWQEAGNWTDIKLPPEPAQPPTKEERAAEIQRLKEAGLL